MAMRRSITAVLLAVSLGAWLTWCERGIAADQASAATAQQVLDATGVKGGLVVHLGCGDGKLTAALRATDAYLVQGLDADPAKVQSARSTVQGLGLYGKVSINQLQGARLPYADNLVNLLVVENAGSVSNDEMLRVLAPNGVAYVRSAGQWTKTVKPRPKDIDEWTHYLHDPSNNAVAHDTAVGPPRQVQWVSDPTWSRHHDHMASVSALVSAGGRIFYIVDEGPREAIVLPSKWMLVARDAFNGTVLWKRPIPEWNTQLWPLKSGPNQLPRRLVAVGDRVYVTLGIDAPLSVLDAVTGKTLLTCDGTQYTDEVLVDDGTLFLLAANSPNKWKEYRPKNTYVWDNSKRANSQWAWDQEERSILAVRADSGAVLWKKAARVAPLTLAADCQRVYFYNGEKVLCLNRADGQQVWTSEETVRKQPFPTGYGPTLVVQQGVVLLSIENKSMTAFSAADGKTLWKAPHHHGGHASPDDMLVIGGLVWSGDVAAGSNSGVFTGRDLRTGEVKSEFPPDVNPPWFHHRCYRSRATDKYFIASRTGIEYIDLDAKTWDFNHWVRGGCLYGFMPSNGLTYAPPNSCGCFLESKVSGFLALAAEKKAESGERKADEAARLERGPAYASVSNPQSLIPSPSPADWPTYRRDAARSGSVNTSVPAELKLAWKAEVGGRLSSVVVADGRVYLAAIDAHTVHAIDAETGKTAWSYTVGARVDSPPTIYQGRVLFGSADGWVYCLRAADGQLAWRFRAAPADRRVVSYDQVESAWPVSGSVLVQNDTVYCVAGRSAFLDGGMRLVRLDPNTGEKLAETVLDDRDPETGKNLQSKMQGQDMPVALPDILSSDGRSVYMRAQAFDLEGQRRAVAPIKLRAGARKAADGEAAAEPAEIAPHLFSRSGFLDDSWFFRSYWIFGKAVDSNYGGWLQPGHFVPCGRIMVFDEKNVFGFDRKPEYLCNASVQEYYMYRADREVSDESVRRVQAATTRINAASKSKSAASSDWALRKKFSLTDQNASTFKWATGDPPIQARAMVLAGMTLFVAGPPDVVNEEEAWQNLDDPLIRARLAAQADALAGKKGGQILAISAEDGRVLEAWELGAMPTFDGMAAANGKLFLTTVDGALVCLGGQGATLAKASPIKLAALDVSVKPIPAGNPAAVGPSLKGDFTRVVDADVRQSELGYRLLAEGRQTGFALKKLETPLTGKVELKVRMQMTSFGKIRNGFLAFGDKADDESLVKCGLRFALKKVMIAQGSLNNAKSADGEFEPNMETTYTIKVTVDVASGEVTMQSAGLTVTTKLKRPIENISYLGYAASQAVVDFSPIEVTTK